MASNPLNVETTARVISQKIYRPDPKNEPDLELGRIELVVQSLVDEDTAATKAVLLVPKDWLWERFLLGRELLITITDHQQELELGDDERRTPGVRVSAQLALPDGGAVTATLDDADRTPGSPKPDRTKRHAASRKSRTAH